MSTYESGTQVVSLGAGVIECIWCVGSVLSVGECMHMDILVLVQTQRDRTPVSKLNGPIPLAILSFAGSLCITLP